jgi:DUF3050 family protein
MAEELAPALVATLRHAPMAMRMLVALCGEDPDKWRQAAETTPSCVSSAAGIPQCDHQRLMQRIPFGVKS